MQWLTRFTRQAIGLLHVVGLVFVSILELFGVEVKKCSQGLKKGQGQVRKVLVKSRSARCGDI